MPDLHPLVVLFGACSIPVLGYCTIRYVIPLIILFFISVGRGFFEGLVIGWYELRAKKVVARCKAEGTRIYDLPHWLWLRSLILDRQRNWEGDVVCKHCKEVTHTPHCHHKQGVAYKPHLAFTPSNLEALCPDCHQACHPEVEIWGSSSSVSSSKSPEYRRGAAARLRAKVKARRQLAA